MTRPADPTGSLRYCARHFTPAEVDTIRALAATLPTRAQIADAACQALNWQRIDGHTKAMSARVALNRMATDGLITLPAPRNTNGNGRHLRHPDPQLPLPTQTTIHTSLADLGRLTLRVVTNPTDSRTYNRLIAAHHYLGYTPLAGAQLRYLVDTPAGIVAALGFTASAWKCAARDTHLGWDTPTRQANLHLVVGNARFLILPHIRVPHLASTILSRATRQLPHDWHTTYGYTPVLAETFVDTERFAGTCYQAANWTHVGHTQGRGKLDRHHQRALPTKDVYLYPLHRAYQTILTTTP